MTLLSVANVSKTYKKATKDAVSNVSFTVDKGDIVAFLGPNGAGKTTTLKMILNLVSPDKGKIFFKENEITNNSTTLLKNTGTLLEGSKNMFWSLSPIENFIYWGGQRGLRKEVARQKGLALLEQFDLLDKKDISITKLSRGMQQIVGICCAMIADPSLLVLDEPTLGLDLSATQIMISNLKRLACNGVGILVTTHQLDFAQKIANKILLINHGKLVFSDSIKSSLDYLNKQIIMDLNLSRPLNLEETAGLVCYCNLVSQDCNSYQLIIKKQEYLPKVLSLLGRLPIIKIQTKTRGLEEIFEHYAKGEIER
ncbi:ABC transporter ATP-binding protein [uncultured Lactobacillus sp.]|uniref:ABC transporter ATP-binding protein n=1 Tax=uncultured Lactobacillus sp. TaxID=153152 RepID=UPI00272CB81E|nr:ABC transporter ATP-binding protein [uncultured Lactobacillus sp.]